MHVSVVVPIYNEIENVVPLCDAVCKAMDAAKRPYEVVLVDDGSTDGSREKLRDLARADRRLKVVELRRNYGQTAAMSAGIDHASGDVIVTMDGDLQNDPADIAMMLDKIDQGYSLVHGWRKNRQDAWLSRKLPSKLANKLIAWATNFQCHDLGCTLKAMRREIAADLRLYGEMHRFIPIMANFYGARCTEVVTTHHPRRAGVSKYGISRTFAVLLDLVTIVYLTRFALKPMRLFGTIGAGAMLTGGVFGLAAVGMRLFADFDLTGNPLLYAALFSQMAALQFLSMGMLAEMSSRTYYESQGRRPYAVDRVTGFDTPELRAAA